MLIRLFALFALAASALVFAQPASAAWHKAESDRFIIYSDSRADDLKEFGEMLERYHVAMEFESGRTVPVPSPSNRLTVFMVGSDSNLRSIYGARNSNVAGLYIPRANGSVAFVPNLRIGRDDFALRVLLHEYAHHFLISSARHAMPRWLSEGAAEYFASARFNRDGSVDIGLPNNDRAYEISNAAEVSLAELLDYDLYRENRGRRYDAFYGRSWLLFHYLAFEPSRPGQLEEYWRAVAGGMDSTEAASRIFGDLDQLSRDLHNYGRDRNSSGMRYPASNIAIGDVVVTPLSEGHADMIDVIIRSKRGVNEEEAAALVEKARTVAASHPDDAEVLAALAEAEYDAGNDDAAIAAAKRAIAADPSVLNAYVQQGYAMFRKAGDAEDKEAAYAAAMAPFEALNALESDHTQPLIYFYRSFTKRGVSPPDGAKFALERATQLAPFDKDLAVEVAAMKAGEGDPVIARYLLAPVAADPHGGQRAALAQAMVDYLETVPDSSRVSFKSLVDQFEAADEIGDEGDDDEGEGGDDAD
jgi:tetratricopeptide (TPR) repeat protein